MVVNLAKMGHNRRENITEGLDGNFDLRLEGLQWKRKL
jgi:hypothetical protein